MNKYFIGFLIAILIIIYFLIKYENENFETSPSLSQSNLITNILGDKYTVIGGNQNKVLLVRFPSSIIPVIIYTNFDNINQQNYYYIYNNGKIMTYLNNNVYFNQASVETISSPNYSYNYKLYKTSDNKLYYLIANDMMYLNASKKNYVTELEITTDPKLALTWEF
jgi:hypothetical protein